MMIRIRWRTCCGCWGYFLRLLAQRCAGRTIARCSTRWLQPCPMMRTHPPCAFRFLVAHGAGVVCVILPKRMDLFSKQWGTTFGFARNNNDRYLGPNKWLVFVVQNVSAICGRLLGAPDASCCSEILPGSCQQIYRVPRQNLHSPRRVALLELLGSSTPAVAERRQHMPGPASPPRHGGRHVHRPVAKADSENKRVVDSVHT